MKEDNVFEYWAFGYNYKLLRDDSAENSKIELLDNIKSFFDYVEHLNLHVTINAAKDLKSIYFSLHDEVFPKEFDNEEEEDEEHEEEVWENRNDVERDENDENRYDLVDKNLSNYQEEKGKQKVSKNLANRVRKAVDQIDTTLDAELELTKVFFVTQKRFGIEYLLYKPSKLFADDVFENLPDIGANDIKDACKAIAYNLPTSAAFHLMRGTESVLRFYYKCLVKKNRSRNPNWGLIIENLKKRRNNRPPKELLDHLNNIRQNFRNPTQHPEKRFDIDEAQDLLSLSIEVINRMIKDLKEKNKLPSIVTIYV